MGCVRGAGGQIAEERLVRCGLALVEHHPDSAVRQVLAEVIALGRRPRRLDLRVVLHQRRIPLTGLRGQESVEALEALAQWPPVHRTRGRVLTARAQMPLSD